MMGMRDGARWGRMNAGVASAVVLLMVMLLVAFVVVPAEDAGSSPSGARSGAELNGEVAWGLSGGLGDPIAAMPAVGEPVSGDVGPAASAGAPTAAARPRSHRELVDLDAARAARVDREAFPTLVARSAGGLASLPAGQRLVSLISTHAAQVEVPRGSGKPVRAAVESMAPLAVESSPGGPLAPVELALEKVGGVFESARPAVGVLIGQHASEGVRAETGVSLTPVDAAGAPLGGAEGQIDGASVIYASTQTNEDTLVKPTSVGFSIDAILRSIDSPRQLYYRVGLPSGAKLLQGGRGAPVRVVSGGATIGLLTPPSAVDAAGHLVPVTMSVLDGDMLSIGVQQIAGELPPVDVDPEYQVAEDKNLTGGAYPFNESYKGGTNWVPFSSPAFSGEYVFKEIYAGESDQQWYIEAPPTGFNGGEAVGLEYKTQGESTVYNLEMWVQGDNEPSQTDTWVEYRYGPNDEGQDNHVLLSGGEHQTRYKYEPLSMTSGYFNEPLETPRGNNVRIVDDATESYPEYGFWTSIWAAHVYVAQETSKHPEVEPTTACPQCGFNTTSPTIAEAAGRTNVMYGAGSWLSPTQGAFEVTARDPGVGLSVLLTSGGGLFHKEDFLKEGKCHGIQCPQTRSQQATYVPGMAEGEYQMELDAGDAIGLYEWNFRTIKVDAKPPEKLEVTGWNPRREISAAPHTLTVSATDEGPNGQKSSGVKSIAVSIDGGQETTLPGASCAEGPCTATGTYALHAEDLSEGVHRLVETATDNAGNVNPREFTFDVRHASPVAVGPGSVDPTTGQFTVNATDVSLGGVAGVARTYQSRDLTAGSDGPLGPQWALNLGASQSLVRLPDGEVALTATDGGRTTFAPTGKGEYLSPLGDENIELEGREKEAGKGISEYLLKDAKAGTTTVFTQPVGTEDTAPIYANQFGQQGAEMGRPVSAAIDGNGDVWVTDYTNDRVLEFSSAGVLLHSYGSEGEWLGNFKGPWGIAINKLTGDVYVSDPGNNRIVELNSSGGFVRAFGWAVSPGGERKEEFQDCTSSCVAGTAGTGAGQLDRPAGVAVDSSGNVWVAEYDSNRIQEFNAEGHYLGSYGTAGTGDGQFEGPLNIAFDGSDMFVSDHNNNRVQELTASGGFVKAIGWGVSNGEDKLEVCTSGCRAGISGEGNGQFNLPWGVAIAPSGEVYVSDEGSGSDNVQELTAEGAFVTKFGSAGSGDGEFDEPMGVAVGAQGEIYVADYVNKRVQEWMRSVWLPARTEDAALKHVVSAYAYKAVEEEGSTAIEPTEVLAATPAGITCVGEHGEVELQFLKDGCRALSFNYAEATTAKGEAPTEWGDYLGHLTRVYFHGYDPASKAMATREVAHYLYDVQGWLRAVWDPRKEPTPESEECDKELLAKGCQAIVYGYDEAGRLTAVTPAGRESWGLVYGTIAGDSNAGRLLKATRAPASAKLWHGEALKSTAAPQVAGSPMVGERLAVSDGSWSGEPVVFGYQWEDCNAQGEECALIPGATSANYAPVSGDINHRLVVLVTATNGGGSATVASFPTRPISSSEGLTVEYSSSFGSYGAGDGQLREAKGDVGVDGAGDVWVADTYDDRLEEFDAGGGFVRAVGSAGEGAGQFEKPEGVTVDSSGHLWVSDRNNARIDEFSGEGAFIKTFGWGVSNGENKFEVCTSSCRAGIVGSGDGEFDVPEGMAVDSKGDIFVADRGNKRVQEFNSEDRWVRNFAQAEEKQGPFGVAVDASGDVWVSYAWNDEIAEFSSSGALLRTWGTAGSEPGQLDIPYGITIGPEGEVWLSEYGNSRVQVFTQTGEYLYGFGSEGNGPGQLDKPDSSVAFNGANVYVLDGGVWWENTGNSRIEKWVRGQQGELRSPQPGTTIEYHVPVSGGGVPQNLSKEEVEKWGQKDDPVEGTAVFAADEPQGWPAGKYTRASIDYIDEEGRTVNTVSPSGGVATSEYNEANELTRALSADNRATAIAEGCISVSKKECKSAEVAEKLSDQNEYNE